MSLLLGRIKDKFGLTRQFRHLSLDELDFTSKETDYLLDDIDDEPPAIPTLQPGSFKKRPLGKDPGKSEPTMTVVVKKEPTDTDIFQNDPKDPVLEPTPGCFVPVRNAVVFPPKQSVAPNITPTKAPVCEEPEPILSLDEMLALDDPTLLDEEVTLEEVLMELESTYIENRDIVVRSDGFVSTPVHALKMLGRKYKEDVTPLWSGFYINGAEDPIIRVQFVAGVFRGVGESFNHRLAAQMAAVDLLRRVQRLGGACPIVPYAMFPGWRIPPRVTEDLLEICKKNGLKYPSYTMTTNDDHLDKPVYVYQLHVGKELMATAESDLPFIARKLAAAKAIYEITGEEYPLIYVAFGSDVMTDDEIIAAGGNPPTYPSLKELGSLSQPKEVSEDDKNETEELEQEKKKLKITVSHSVGPARRVSMD